MSVEKKHIVLTRATHRLFFDENKNLTKDAEMFLGEMVGFCHMMRPSIKVNKDGITDIPATMMAEGRREVATRLFTRLGLDINQVMRLEKLFVQTVSDDK